MGIIIKARDLPAFEQSGIQRLIIYCKPDKAILDSAVTLNVELAKKLAAIKPNRRTMRMEQCFRQVIETLPDETVIKDFDVLFNPDYGVDILRIMSSLAKSKPYRIVWPGTCDGRRLIYAEEGFCDYKVYEIEKYDVTCVVWRKANEVFRID